MPLFLGVSPASLCSISLFSSNLRKNLSTLRDSSSDCRNKRPTRWPLDRELRLGPVWPPHWTKFHFFVGGGNCPFRFIFRLPCVIITSDSLTVPKFVCQFQRTLIVRGMITSFDRFYQTRLFLLLFVCSKLVRLGASCTLILPHAMSVLSKFVYKILLLWTLFFTLRMPDSLLCLSILYLHVLCVCAQTLHIQYFHLLRVLYLSICSFLMGQSRPLFRLFSVFSNKHYNFYNKYWWKMSIHYMVLGFEPTTFGREYLPITTRPGLPSIYLFLLLMPIYLKQMLYTVLLYHWPKEREREREREPLTWLLVEFQTFIHPKNKQNPLSVRNVSS